MSFPQMSGSPVTTNYTPAADTPTKVLTKRANRAGWVIQNQGANDVYWSESASVSNTGVNRGNVIKGGQTPPDYFADAGVFNGDIYVAAHGGAGDICVTESVPQNL